MLSVVGFAVFSFDLLDFKIVFTVFSLSFVTFRHCDTVKMPFLISEFLCHDHCITNTVTPDIFSCSVGIKTADNQSEGVLLHVAGMACGVSISKLDDSDISEVNFFCLISYFTILFPSI